MGTSFRAELLSAVAGSLHPPGVEHGAWQLFGNSRPSNGDPVRLLKCGLCEL